VNPLFEFQDVTVRLNDADVLHHVSLAIPESKLTVIAGASGSGKSTLLRCCNRLEVPSSGSIKYLGEEVSSVDPLMHRRSVAMVFQHPVTFPGSVFQNLRAAVPDLTQKRALQLCSRVALKVDLLEREADSLSGGEAQRMVIARALATKPKVLLADEPTSGLDGDSTRRIEELVVSLVSDGTPVVWVTHDLQQIWRLAQHLVVLKDGRVLFSGPADDARAAPAIDESWLTNEP